MRAIGSELTAADIEVSSHDGLNVPELIAAIQEYLDNHNQNPKTFKWTPSLEQILAKVAKCKEALETLH